jgi:cytochrome b involved in lipid metabolism
MAERVFTLSQVAQHKSKKDCWLVVNGRVNLSSLSLSLSLVLGRVKIKN